MLLYCAVVNVETWILRIIVCSSQLVDVSFRNRLRDRRRKVETKIVITASSGGEIGILQDVVQLDNLRVARSTKEAPYGVLAKLAQVFAQDEF